MPTTLPAQYKDEVGSPRTFIDALLWYWRETVELLQRQAKAAERKGEMLTADDARRVGSYTAT